MRLGCVQVGSQHDELVAADPGQDDRELWPVTGEAQLAPQRVRVHGRPPLLHHDSPDGALAQNRPQPLDRERQHVEHFIGGAYVVLTSASDVT